MTDQTPKLVARSAARIHAACKSWPIMLLSFRPGKLAVLALAIAVAGWSSSSRISQFVFHSDPAHRLPRAKAIPEHRLADAAPTKARIRLRAHSQANSTALGPVHGLQRIAFSLTARAPLALSAHRASFFKSGIPLRSPPALA